MVWSYMIDNITYSNNTTTAGTTTASDYFSDWDRLFTTTGTGTTYSPYWQACTFISETAYIGRQESYYDQGFQEPCRPQEPVQPSPEKIKEEAEAKAAATERAKNLLLEYLDDDNKQKLLNNKPLEVPSRLFNNVKYHIPLSKLGRIKAWKDNQIITELCLSVKEIEQLPIEDIILTKLLYTLHDEANMIKTANHSNVQENLLTGLN